VVSSVLPFMVIVAGAPYNGLAKEREGAPSFFPHCSCPFYNILPSFFVAALTIFHLAIITGHLIDSRP